MDTESIKKYVSTVWPEAVFDHEDDRRFWFAVLIVSSFDMMQANLPYWQLLPKNGGSMWLVVFK